MDSVQAVSEAEEVPSSISTVPEKVSSLSRVQALIRILLFVGWLMVLSDGVGLAMVMSSYHENTGVFMVIFGLLGGMLFLGSAFFLQSKVASKMTATQD